MDIVLAGTGPSMMLAEDKWQKSSIDTHLATVNSGVFSFQEAATYYGVFENGGIRMYHDEIKKKLMYDAKVFIKHEGYVSTWAQKYIHDVSQPPHIVGELFGPTELQWMNKDKQYPDSKETWISSGVMMLWVLAHVYKPGTIYVAGLDGYKVIDDYHKSIADETVTRYKKAYEPIEWEQKTDLWRQRMNNHMSEAIAAITQYYKDVKFVWLSKPNHYKETWRVEIESGVS